MLNCCIVSYHVLCIFLFVLQGVSVEEWYSQVRQLRRDAEDYKRRGQQTHFSREHLAQLSARNAQLWDIVSSHRYDVYGTCACVCMYVCL